MGNNARTYHSTMQTRELSNQQPPITAWGTPTFLARLSPKESLARSTESSQSPHQRLYQSLYLGLLLCSSRSNVEWGQPGQITKHFLQNAIVGIPSWAWAPTITPRTHVSQPHSPLGPCLVGPHPSTCCSPHCPAQA